MNRSECTLGKRVYAPLPGKTLPVKHVTATVVGYPTADMVRVYYDNKTDVLVGDFLPYDLTTLPPETPKEKDASLHMTFAECTVGTRVTAPYASGLTLRVVGTVVAQGTKSSKDLIRVYLDEPDDLGDFLPLNLESFVEPLPPQTTSCSEILFALDLPVDYEHTQYLVEELIHQMADIKLPAGTQISRAARVKSLLLGDSTLTTLVLQHIRANPVASHAATLIAELTAANRSLVEENERLRKSHLVGH